MPKPSTFKAPLRYLAVVLCGYSADFTLYAMLVSSGVSVYWANLAGFSLGMAINVLLIRRFVFPDSRFKLGVDLLLTMMANGMLLLIGMGILWLQVEMLTIDPYWAKLVTNGFTFLLNFMTRAVLFRGS